MLSHWWNCLQRTYLAKQLVTSFSRVICSCVGTFAVCANTWRGGNLVLVNHRPQWREVKQLYDVGTSFTWLRYLPINPKWPITYELWGRCEEHQSGAFHIGIHPPPCEIVDSYDPAAWLLPLPIPISLDRTQSSRKFRSNTWNGRLDCSEEC